MEIAYLNTAGVTTSTLEQLMVFLAELAKRCQAPTGSLTNKTKNGRKVVRKHDHGKPGAVAQPCNLEDLCEVHMSGVHVNGRDAVRTFILLYQLGGAEGFL